jgi:hypothetical protein
MNARNSLTIAETKDILCAEHAARLFVAECWWALIPAGDKNPLSFASTGNAQPFWALINAALELGMPLGFEKIENHLRRLTNVAHSDPEKVLRSILKPQPRATLPDMRIIEARAKHIPGANAQQMFNEAKAAYDAEVEAEYERINATIKDIMRQRPVAGDEPFETATKLGAFNEETGEYDEFEVTFGEWEIPIDRIIEFGERQLKFMATNKRVPDVVFGTENALWEGEINVLSHIVQQREHEGAGESSREIDEALLNGSGMAAGMSSGK